LSKTLGAGLPLGATVTTTAIAEAARKNGFLYLTTHLNDPLTAAIGVKVWAGLHLSGLAKLFLLFSQVLEIVVRDNLTARASHLGKIMREGFLGLQRKHKVIGDVRGRGLLQGIEIVAPPELGYKGDKLGSLIGDRAMELGLSCNIVNLDGFTGVFRIAPPLVVTEEELQRGIDILDQSITQILDEIAQADEPKKMVEQAEKPVTVS
jgi:4-aminobutyrate aminotransferase-like enzyme